MPWVPSAVAGSQLKWTITSTLTLVPGVQGISFSGGSRTDIEVTGIDQATQQFVGGRRESEEMSFSLAWDPEDATHAGMLANYTAGTATAVAMTLTFVNPGASIEAFSGYVKLFQTSLDNNGALQANVVIKLTTARTLTV